MSPMARSGSIFSADAKTATPGRCSTPSSESTSTAPLKPPFNDEKARRGRHPARFLLAARRGSRRVGGFPPINPRTGDNALKSSKSVAINGNRTLTKSGASDWRDR